MDKAEKVTSVLREAASPQAVSLLGTRGALRHSELSAVNAQPAGRVRSLYPDAGQTPWGIHNVLSPRNGVLLGPAGVSAFPDSHMSMTSVRGTVAASVIWWGRRMGGE